MEISKEEFIRNLEKLRKNETSVPAELLRTKYQEAYNKLRREICSFANEFMKACAIGGIRVLKTDMSILPKIQTAANDKEIWYRANLALFRDKSYPEFEAAALALHQKVQDVYIPYFQRHCHRLDDGTIHSNILDLDWNSDRKTWEGVTADGRPCWSSYISYEEKR